MPRLRVDDREVEVPDGATVLDAARRLGIDVPALCFMEGREPATSCMCCLVRIDGSEEFVPACATRAAEGMRVESETPDVHDARRVSLELLLSDHLGDCLAPCQCICPAGMNIPLMIRQIAAGRVADAVVTIKEHIALPAVLGRICPAPCEKGCRRGGHDEPVSIMRLKRYPADVDLASARPWMPECRPDSGRSVAVVGAGPTGLAAAFYLRRIGHACTLFDDHPAPGGMLRYGVPASKLPRDVLDAEIGVIEALGARFRMNVRVGSDLSPDDLRRDHDAVLLAVGKLEDASTAEESPDAFFWPHVAVGPRGIEVDGRTLQTSAPGVFAGGDAVRSRRLTVRAVADGRSAAIAIDQHLRGAEVTGAPRPFTVHIGKLRPGEMERFLVEADARPRVDPAGGDAAGFTDAEARAEAERCLHCDCRKPDACTLRRYAAAYGARPARYPGDRRAFLQHREHPEIIYEPGKCIACGLCIQIAAAAGERLGLTFIRRGLDVRVVVPFGRPLSEGLETVAAECVAACPTAALAFKETPQAGPGGGR